MLPTLSVSRRLIAVALVVATLYGSGGGFAVAQPTAKLAGALPLKTIELGQATHVDTMVTPEPELLAHHEGATSAVSSLLGDGMAASEDAMDSLWGSMIAGIAYRRDPEMQRLVKRAGRSNTLFLLSVASISGLSLAQNITGLATLNASNSQAHGEGGEEHEHGGGGHHDSIAPSVMGLVGSGLTLGSIGAHAYFGHRYQKRIEQRRQVINARVLHVLDALEAGSMTDSLQTELIGLIGERASREFMQIWSATH